MFLGDETLSETLRRHCHRELTQHADTYVREVEQLCEAMGQEYHVFQHSILGEDCFAAGDGLASFEIDCKKTITNGRWSSIHHVMAMSTILGQPIISLFPDSDTCFGKAFNTEIKPARQIQSLNLGSPQTRIPIVILWSRAGSLCHDAAYYEPNHVVPIFLEDDLQQPLKKKPRQAQLHQFFAKSVSTSKSMSTSKSVSTKHQSNPSASFTVNVAAVANKPVSAPTDTVSAPCNKAAVRGNAAASASTSRPASSCRNKTYDSNHRVRKYLPKWEQDYAWLKHDNGKMYCTTCLKMPKMAETSGRFFCGTDHFRMQALRSHNLSRKHVDCLRAVNAKNNPQNQPMDMAIYNMTTDTLDKLEKLFRTAYYLAITEQPMSRFQQACELQNMNGAVLGETYANDASCKMFLHAINETMVNDLVADLHNSSTFSLLTDGSTDSGIIEEEIMFVKYMKGGVQTTKFLSIQPPETGNGVGLKAAVEKGFESVGFLDWKQHITSIGTDGAAVNTGQNNGLVALLKKDGMPWLTGFWCAAHLFERGLLSAMTDEKFLVEIKEVLQGLYKHYHYSPKSVRELKGVAEALEQRVLKSVNVLGTRWAPHMYRALEVLLKRNYQAIFVHFNHTAQGEDASPVMVGRAKKVVSQLQNYKLILYMHFMLDILEQCSILSTTFQRDTCSLNMTNDALARFILSIEGLKHSNGPNLQRFLSEVTDTPESIKWEDIDLKRGTKDLEQFENSKARILDRVIDHTQNRFNHLETTSLLKASKVIDPLDWPQDIGELAIYGNSDIDTVAAHFAEPLSKVDYDVEAAQNEWTDLKSFTTRHMKGFNMARLWSTVLTEHTERFPNLCLIAETIFVYPLNTACCERGFSVMKKIKNDWRASLDPETLCMLLRIALDGVSLKQFQPRFAVEHWWFKGQRSRRPNIKD